MTTRCDVLSYMESFCRKEHGEKSGGLDGSDTRTLICCLAICDMVLYSGSLVCKGWALQY